MLMVGKGTRIAKIILKKNKTGRPTLPDLKTYNVFKNYDKVTVKRKHGIGKRTDTQINGTERRKSIEINQYEYVTCLVFFFYRVTKAIP